MPSALRTARLAVYRGVEQPRQTPPREWHVYEVVVDNLGVVLVGQATPTEGSGAGSGEGSGELALTELVLDQYYGREVLQGLAVLLVLWAILRLYQRTKEVSSYGEGLDRAVRVQLKRYENEAKYGSAGDLLFANERWEEAAELYGRADDWIRAGEALDKGGQISRAAQMFKRANAPMMAAEAYLKRNQYQLAAKEFLVADAGERAADAFYKANDYRRAAELYRRHDRLREAGDSYERIGDLEQATEFYDKFFTRQLDIARGDLSQVQPAVKVAERAAELLLELDKKSEAADLLLRAGSRRRAAELFASVGEIDRAADIYFEAKRPMLAAQLYESVGNREMALFYRGEARLLKGEKTLAADDFAAAGKHIRAADLYNEVGQPSRAAEMFEAAGDLRMAAEFFRSADMPREAAEAYERAGDHAAAIELYRAMGDHKAELQAAKSGNNYFRVGEILLEHGRKEDALAAFQRVDAIDSEFEHACIVQGDILRELQRLDIAFNKYKSALGNAAPSKANVDILYKMARTADDANVPQQALRLYESVIGIDYYYQDASERATNIRKKLDQAGARQQALGANESGAFASPVPLRQPSGQHSLVPKASAPSRYEILEEVARGGMGIVYKARDTVLDRVVAYKILSSNLKTNKVAVKYFLREAQAAAKMSHPNIVTVFDAGEQDGEYYMAMEFVEGQTLKQLVNRQGAFPEKLVRYIFVHVCRGLTYAHERGLVHRDVKPGNLMLTRDRTVKIMDFGLAKFVQEVQANHTRAIGTPYYMSPEQVLGKDLDGRSDIYSLGVSMFECATGRVPFEKGDLSYHHLNTAAPHIRDLNGEMSEELDAVIFRCMAKQPEDRFASAHELMLAAK